MDSKGHVCWLSSVDLAHFVSCSQSLLIVMVIIMIDENAIIS